MMFSEHVVKMVNQIISGYILKLENQLLEMVNIRFFIWIQFQDNQDH